MGRRKKSDSIYAKRDENSEILDRVNGYISLATKHCEQEHRRVEDNARFERGEQWAAGDAERQKERERPALPLNSMHKLLNAVANREIMDRFRPTVYARNRDGAGAAELLDVSSTWQRDTAETEHEETIAFRRMCASGYGVIHKWWDPSAMDGDGAFIDEEVPIWNMLWDPAARRQNLVDRRWHVNGKYIDLNDVEAIFGENKRLRMKKAAIKSSSKSETEHYGGEGSDGHLPGGSWGQVLGDKWFSLSGEEVFVIEAEWKERKQIYKVAFPILFPDFAAMVSGEEGASVPSPTDGQPITLEEYQALPVEAQMQLMDLLLSVTEMKKFDAKSDFEGFLEQYEAIVGKKFEDYSRGYKDCVYYAIITDDEVLASGERPSGFTYEFMTGFPYETTSTIQFYGMIDVAKGPQDFKNVFYSNLLTMYMTSPKQHLIIEEGALKDTQAFLNEYSKVTGVSIVPDGFVAGGRFLQLESPRFPPMLESLINVVEGSVQEIFGLSSIEQGTQGDLRRISGNVVQSAKAATNTLLAILFDGLRRYRKRFGLLTAKSMVEYYSPQELRQIVGTDYDLLGEVQFQVTSLQSWPKEIKFDVKIDEAPASITEQMATVDYLTRTGTLEKWVSNGDLPFDEALDLLVTIPKTTRERIKRARNEKQKIAQQISQLQGELQKQMVMQEAFVKFIQAREGGAQILADFSLLQVLAAQQAEAMVQQQQQQQQEQIGGPV